MGELADLRGLDRNAPVWNGHTDGCHPGDWLGVLHHQHRRWDCTGRRRATRRLRATLSGSMESHQSAAGVYGGCPRHSAEAGSAAVLEYPSLSTAVLAGTAASDAPS